jgi:hypothetical protein
MLSGTQIHLSRVFPNIEIFNGQNPSGLYDSVMIDECHDFEADWLQLATQTVSPATSSFLLFSDNPSNL